LRSMSRRNPFRQTATEPHSATADDARPRSSAHGSPGLIFLPQWPLHASHASSQPSGETTARRHEAAEGFGDGHVTFWTGARTYADSPAESRASLVGVGQRTSYTQPNFSNSQINRAEISICPRLPPCRAEVGSAWCRLCHDSPKDRIASGQKFADLSRAAN